MTVLSSPSPHRYPGSQVVAARAEAAAAVAAASDAETRAAEARAFMQAAEAELVELRDLEAATRTALQVS